MTSPRQALTYSNGKQYHDFFSRDQNEGTEVRQHIAKVIMRGDYGWDHTYNNDIALLKMVRPVIFNTRIAPVCLPDQGVQVQEGTKCYVSGKYASKPLPSSRRQFTRHGLAQEEYCL